MPIQFWFLCSAENAETIRCDSVATLHRAWRYFNFTWRFSDSIPAYFLFSHSFFQLVVLREVCSLVSHICHVSHVSHSERDTWLWRCSTDRSVLRRAFVLGHCVCISSLTPIGFSFDGQNNLVKLTLITPESVTHEQHFQITRYSGNMSQIAVTLTTCCPWFRLFCV